MMSIALSFLSIALPAFSIALSAFSITLAASSAALASTNHGANYDASYNAADNTTLHNSLPSLGDSDAGLMPPAQERLLGQAWLRNYRATAPLQSDPLLYEYLEQQLATLTSYSQIKNKQLSLVVVDDPTLNAFAVPGGVIGLHSGLLSAAQTEAQLVSVLCHELAHLSQRHFARSVEAAQRVNLASLTALLAGIALASQGGGDAATAAIATSQAIAIDSQLRYSRLHEQEADRIGMALMVEAGYPAEAATEMFKQMLDRSRFDGNRVPEFLLTHPVTESRIADASNRARRHAAQTQPTAQSRQPSQHYLLMQARVRALSDESAGDKVRHFQKQLSLQGATVHSAQRDAARYGLAMAYLQQRQWQQAKQTLAPLRQQIPSHTAYTLLDIEIDLAAGHSEQAEKRLRDLNAVMPENYAVSMLLAKTLMENKRYQDGQQLLQLLTKNRPERADIWYLLAEIEGLAGDIVNLHQSRAEFFFLTGRYKQAKKQLRYALKLSRENYHVSAKIKQRIRQISATEKAIASL